MTRSTLSPATYSRSFASAIVATGSLNRYDFGTELQCYVRADAP